ncbi:MaoC family dehydratase N-terminal domain-containing protein [Phytohabitans flavus]|uniref:FAS1-like dehydratase domain-containing protein n=1 Tax=Phytohabitans flavus TaxID=1076124 RepID=UPI00362D6A8A
MAAAPVRATEPAALRRELRALVGTVSAPRTRPVLASDVHRFRLATAAGGCGEHRPDRRPCGRVGGTPTFFCPDPLVAAEALGLPRPRPLSRTIDGGSQWQVVRPVRVGDTLTLVARIAAITPRTTADGRPMVLTVIEVLAWNQDGHQVGVARGTSVSYEERVS